MTPTQFRSRLERAGITQTELANYLGVQFRTVNRWATTQGVNNPLELTLLYALDNIRHFKAWINKPASCSGWRSKSTCYSHSEEKRK